MEDEEDGQVGQAELVADKELPAGLLQEGLDVTQEGGDEADKDAADYVDLLLDALGAEDGQPLWNGRDTASTSASHCQREEHTFLHTTATKNHVVLKNHQTLCALTVVVVADVVDNGVDRGLLHLVPSVEARLSGQEPGDGQGLAKVLAVVLEHGELAEGGG